MAAVCATAMPGRSQIEERRTLRHDSGRPLCQVRPMPSAEKAMTAWDDARCPILRSKIIERPHHTDLKFESCDLNRIGRIVAMKLLVAFPRQYLNTRRAPELIIGARRQEDGIGHIQYHRVSDQLGAARRVAQHAAAPKRLGAAEARALTLIEFIERRSQLGGADVDQFDLSQIADDNAAVAPQNIDNRCR